MANVKLIIDSPKNNSSMIYASQYYCYDPFIYLETGLKKIGWMPSTEIGKAKQDSNLDEVYNLSDALIALKKQKKYPYLKSSIVIQWLKENKLKEVAVPENFPVIEAENLKKHKIKVTVLPDPFFKERVSKTDAELAFIRKNSKKNVEVYQEIHQLLAESTILNDGRIQWDKQVLTSEVLQNFILKSLLDKGMVADSVIAASGDQGCYPHENGSGVIYAHTSIIIDIFPKSRDNWYYTDMTRTFCKGKASNELKSIYNHVKIAQQMGLDLVCANADGKAVHQQLQDYFLSQGFKTSVLNGVLQGFFHGTGHGLGLDCHESPYISSNGTLLPLNSVVSVEPGLYYLGKGAVRIEDLVVVKENGIENLTEYEKVLEIE